MQLLDMPTDAVLAVMEATVTSLGLFQTASFTKKSREQLHEHSSLTAI